MHGQPVRRRLFSADSLVTSAVVDGDSVIAYQNGSTSHGARLHWINGRTGHLGRTMDWGRGGSVARDLINGVCVVAGGHRFTLLGGRVSPLSVKPLLCASNGTVAVVDELRLPPENRRRLHALVRAESVRSTAVARDRCVIAHTGRLEIFTRDAHRTLRLPDDGSPSLAGFVRGCFAAVSLDGVVEIRDTRSEFVAHGRLTRRDDDPIAAVGITARSFVFASLYQVWAVDVAGHVAQAWRFDDGLRCVAAGRDAIVASDVSGTLYRLDVGATSHLS